MLRPRFKKFLTFSGRSLGVIFVLQAKELSELSDLAKRQKAPKNASKSLIYLYEA